MQTELRIQATVLPGHRLEVCDPQLPDGAKVDVTVVVPEQRIYLRQSMLEYVATLPPGPLLHRTVEDANRSLQKERDAWRGASHNRYESPTRQPRDNGKEQGSRGSWDAIR